MKIAVFLSALFCLGLAAPNPMEDDIHPPGPAYSPEPTLYSNPAPAVGLARAAAAPVGPAATHAKSLPAASGTASAVGVAGGAAAAGGAVAAASKNAAAGAAGAGAVVGILRDDRVVDKSGTYSFDVAGEDGIARQESGAPLPEGGITQTGSYTYIQRDGTPFELKYVADANGFQPESKSLPALPQFVLDQIEFAKNNPEPEAAAAGAKARAAEGAGAGAGAGAAAGAGAGALAGAKAKAAAPGYNPYLKR